MIDERNKRSSAEKKGQNQRYEFTTNVSISISFMSSPIRQWFSIRCVKSARERKKNEEEVKEQKPYCIIEAGTIHKEESVTWWHASAVNKKIQFENVLKALAKQNECQKYDICHCIKRRYYDDVMLETTDAYLYVTSFTFVISSIRCGIKVIA